MASVAAIVLLLASAQGAMAAGSRDVLQRYARDTRASFVAMTDEQSGLPADSLDADGPRSVQTTCWSWP